MARWAPFTGDRLKYARDTRLRVTDLFPVYSQELTHYLTDRIIVIFWNILRFWTGIG